MIIVSYDIKEDKVRTKFAKLLEKNGAIRLQYSVYEFNNTKRLSDILLSKIEQFAKKFTGTDSVIILEGNVTKLKKYGNAIHRDLDVVFF
jgi:CRISPR-associated protein Cas2